MEMLSSNVHKVYTAGLEAVKPAQLVRQALQVDTSTGILYVRDGTRYQLQDRNVLLVGFGKAVLGMTLAVHSLLSDHIRRGIISVPVGAIDQQLQLAANSEGIGLLLNDTRISITEGAPNNLPDITAEKTARQILALVSDATQEDLIIALISGGGSALLPLPVEGISLEDKRKTIELLSSAGATINQINIVRQSLSQVKGGKLARHVYPSKLLGLILSDIINDPLEYIASGPTVPQSINHHIARDLIKDSFPHISLPHSVTKYLSSLTITDQAMTTSPASNVRNVLIGSNKMAVSAAADSAKGCGYDVIVWSHALQGEAKDIGRFYARIADLITTKKGDQNDEFSVTKLRTFLNSVLVPEEDLVKLSEELRTLMTRLNSGSNSNRLCIISGGEPTVTIKGKGRGGRNQELVLSFAREIHHLLEGREGERTEGERREGKGERTEGKGEGGREGGREKEKKEMQLLLASVGTDGQDGPTDVAGAMADTNTWRNALKGLEDPNSALDNNDSYNLLAVLCDGAYHIRTGLTGTNVMDIHILMIHI